MISRPRIYVDYDDVLCETALMFTRVLGREFGRQVAFDDIFSFNLQDSFGLSPAETDRLMHRVHLPDVLLAMEPLGGAAEALSRWRAAGFSVCIVTGRPSSTQAASREWLQQCGMPYDDLLFVDKYSRGHAPEPGATVVPLEELLQQDFCLAVEDAPDMARLLAARTRIPVVLFDRPWNARVDTPAHGASLTRCRGWAEIAERFARPQPARFAPATPSRACGGTSAPP